MPNQSNHPNYSPAVANLQRYLRQLAYHTEKIGQVPVDGIFDSATQNALSDYQRTVGLPVTGTADRETWERLYADYLASLALYSPPTPVSLFLQAPPDGYLDLGAVGIDVAVLQYMLGELTLLYLLTPPMVTGEYDAATQNAVKEMQEYLGIVPNGLVDILTWNAITDRFNSLPAGSEAQ
ncbi:MAG: peptidoglycan-binding protein [Clostridia bacterium]|jgi:murein L,D-transpeptidase YcbB/YkuD|nr:peptidoglycan-binding protein [Clostridia bacterium]MBO7296981.1 peptidoglycan-binding protein [Clostridia bacterium]